jgi:hypothetical protein
MRYPTAELVFIGNMIIPTAEPTYERYAFGYKLIRTPEAFMGNLRYYNDCSLKVTPFLLLET